MFIHIIKKELQVLLFPLTGIYTDNLGDDYLSSKHGVTGYSGALGVSQFEVWNNNGNGNFLPTFHDHCLRNNHNKRSVARVF